MSRSIKNNHGQVMASPVNYISNAYFVQRLQCLCSGLKLSWPISLEQLAFWQKTLTVFFNSLVLTACVKVARF